MVREGQVILALTNPDPEITPKAALEAGAAFAADGSMVNNVLGFPGIFRGALASGARGDLHRDEARRRARDRRASPRSRSWSPTRSTPQVHREVAEAVADAAAAEGLARPERVPAGL